MEIPVNNKRTLNVTLKNGYLTFDGDLRLDEGELVSLFNILSYARSKDLRFDDLVSDIMDLIEEA